MARSERIYVVVNYTGAIVSAFTVKHEMISWIEHYRKSHDDWDVFSVQDGKFQLPFGAKYWTLVTEGGGRAR